MLWFLRGIVGLRSGYLLARTKPYSRVILKRHGEFICAPLPMLRGGEETTPLVSVCSAASVEPPPPSLARRMTKRQQKESIILFLCRSVGATTDARRNCCLASRDSRKLATFSQV